MICEKFHLPALGHASYLLGCERTGQALVFGPRRDVENYLAAARRHGLQIRYVIDSHGHNDYLSGLTALVARTGAQPLAPVEAEVGYFAQALRDREIVEFGDVAVQALATPGHTPEHTSLLISDRTVGDEQALLLSGGALLVGDVARPDLLGGPDQVRAAAEEFCHTMAETILPLSDGVQVWPTHVAGSMCGGNIGSRLSTTIGYERRTNPILARAGDAGGFTAACVRTDNLPTVQLYWARMRTENLTGVAWLGVLAEPAALTPAQLADAQRDGMTVLDTRAPEAFAGGHVPGAINVGLDGAFPTWAGTVLPADAATVLVLGDPARLWTPTTPADRTPPEKTTTVRERRPEAAAARRHVRPAVNMTRTERVLRILAGLALPLAAWLVPLHGAAGAVGWAVVALGSADLLLSGAIGFCPLYRVIDAPWALRRPR